MTNRLPLTPFVAVGLALAGVGIWLLLGGSVGNAADVAPPPVTVDAGPAPAPVARVVRDIAAPQLIDFASLDPGAIYDRPFAARGAVGVDPAAPLLAVFSEAVDPTAFDPGQVSLEIGHTLLPIGEIAWRTPTELLVHPHRPLPPGAWAKLVVRGPIRDMAGNISGQSGEILGEFVCHTRLSHALHATAADFTANGRADVAVGGPSKPLEIWPNRGAVPQPPGWQAGMSDDVRAVASGDFLGDGRADVAVVREDAATHGLNLTIYSATQTGQIGEITFPLSPGRANCRAVPPVALVTGDFTGNGWLDLLLVDPFGRHRLAANHRGQTFIVTAWPEPADSMPLITAAAVADLNGDSFADLITADSAGTIWVAVNDRAGARFAAQVAMRDMGLVAAMAAGDVDHDGDADLLLGLLGQPDELLVNATDVGGPVKMFRGMPVGMSDDLALTRAVALIDLNSDGNLDVVTAGVDVPGVSVSLNDRFGGFDPPIRVSGAAGSGAGDHTPPADRDADRDGLALDFRAADGGANGASHTAADGVCGLLGADFDGDGCNDIFATTERGRAFFLLTSHGLFRAPPAVTGELSFTNRDDLLPATSGPVRAAAAGDIDRDGRVDLVVGLDGGGVEVWLRLADERFMPSDELPGLLGAHVALIDVDRDGYLDLLDFDLAPDARPGELRADPTMPLVRVAYNGGERAGRAAIEGQFGDPVPFVGWPMWEPVRAALVADFDGDGLTDVYLGGASSSLLLMASPVDGGWEMADLPAEVTDPRQAAPITGLVAGDFDGDGRLDLAVSTASREDGEPAPNWWLQNRGERRFDAVALPDSTEPSMALAAGDFDANATPDLAWLVPDGGRLEVRLHRRQSGAWDSYAMPVQQFFDALTGLTLLDLDRDGTPDAVVNGVHTGDGWQAIWRCNGYGALQPDITGSGQLRGAAGPLAMRPLLAVNLLGDTTPELLMVDDAGIPHLLSPTLN